MAIVEFSPVLFPRIHSYVTRDFSNLPLARPRVFKAVLRATLDWPKRERYPSHLRHKDHLERSVQEARLRGAFLNGSGPPIRIGPVQGRPKYAEYDGGVIVLWGNVAAQVEAGLAARGDSGTGTSMRPSAPVPSRLRLLLESILTHEMVHWAWEEVLKDIDPSKRHFRYPDDIGWEFSRLAYGRDVTASNLGLKPGVLNLPIQ
jgi:hypothetical protein